MRKDTGTTPLTEIQIRNNNKKSKTRVRVEHVFGFMHQSIGGLFIRTIGQSKGRYKSRVDEFDVQPVLLNMIHATFRGVVCP